jgi:hypothetical protein
MKTAEDLSTGRTFAVYASGARNRSVLGAGNMRFPAGSERTGHTDTTRESGQVAIGGAL